MDETQHTTERGIFDQTLSTVFVLEQNGYLTGPFAARPRPGLRQTVHETSGFVHAFDRTRDWFDCPWCQQVVTGEELAHLELGHECDETTLDR